MLCAFSSRSALHFDHGVEQACSAAARVLLACPSRTTPSSASSCLLIFLYEALPHAEGRRLRNHVSRGSVLPSSGSTSPSLCSSMRGKYLYGGRTDVLSRPRLPVSSGIAFCISSLLTACSAESICARAAGRVFPVATEYNFQSSVE